MKTPNSRKVPEVRRVIIFINPKNKNAKDLANDVIKELNSLDIKTIFFLSAANRSLIPKRATI